VQQTTNCNPLNTCNELLTIEQSLQPQEVQMYIQEAVRLGDFPLSPSGPGQFKLQSGSQNESRIGISNYNSKKDHHPDYQITPCETEMTQHLDMDEKNNALQQSSHRNFNHSSRYRKQLPDNAVATNLGQKYQSIVKKQPFNNNILSQLDTKRSYHVNNASVCLTEEIPLKSTINPVNLADKDWTDPYKLNKLLTQQKKNQYMANQIFGNECTCNCNSHLPQSQNHCLLSSFQSFQPQTMGSINHKSFQVCPSESKIGNLFQELATIEKKLLSNAQRQNRQARRNRKAGRNQGQSMHSGPQQFSGHPPANQYQHGVLISSIPHTGTTTKISSHKNTQMDDGPEQNEP